MGKSWMKAASVVASAALLASIVPAVLSASAEDTIPDVSSWKYVMAMDFEAKETGAAVSTWGGYGGMVSDVVTDGIGANGSKGLKVYSLVEAATDTKKYIQPFYAEGTTADFTGAEEIWFWMDLTSYANLEKTNFQLRPRLKVAGADDDLYLTSGSPYYIQDGNGGWIIKNCNTSENAGAKCALKGANLAGYKGYVRMPLSSFGNLKDGSIDGFTIGYQVYDFQFTTNEDFEMVENSWVMDNWLMAGSNMVNDSALKVKSLLAGPAPSIEGYSYKFIDDMEAKAVGSSYEKWGGYCKSVADMIAAGVGADGTKGMEVSSTADKDGSNYTQPFYYTGATADYKGATELLMWLDMSSYESPDNLTIRPRLVVDGANNDIKMRSGAVYYLQSGDDWVSSTFGVKAEPTAESYIPKEDLAGFKGYIRLPLSSFNDVKEGDITGFAGMYWIYNFSFVVNDDFEYVKNGFVVDNLLLAGKSMTDGAGITTLFDGSLAPDPTKPTDDMVAAANAAKEAIAALPAASELTLEDEADVVAARELFDAVDPLALSLVDNLQTLVTAEGTIQSLKDAAAAAEADKEAAKTVTETIDALKNAADITLSDSEAVKAARTAYDALTPTQKALVTNLAKLEGCEEQVSLLANRRPEDPDPSWKYLTVVDFENLANDYDFASEEDGNGYKYMFGPQDNKSKYYHSIITQNGYNGSNGYTLQGIAGNVKGSYAQPLLRLDQLNNSQFKDYSGAEEMVLYVDFTNIKLDCVGMQLRFMENDFTEDGTVSTGITQWGLKDGAYVYMLDANGNWVKACNSDSKYESAQNKLPVEVTGRVEIAADPDSDLYKDGLPEVAGYKGFIRIPLSQFEVIESSPNINNKMDLKQVTQLWMVFNYPTAQDGAYFVIDQVGFDGNFAVANQGEVPVLNYLSMSTGNAGANPSTDPTTPTTDTTSKVPAPSTGAAMPVACLLLTGCAAAVCVVMSKKNKKTSD